MGERHQSDLAPEIERTIRRANRRLFLIQNRFTIVAILAIFGWGAFVGEKAGWFDFG